MDYLFSCKRYGCYFHFLVNNDMVVGIHESTIESQMLGICEILAISMKNKNNGCLIILIFP